MHANRHSVTGGKVAPTRDPFAREPVAYEAERHGPSLCKKKARFPLVRTRPFLRDVAESSIKWPGACCVF
jgi:hypothetical protein